MTARVEFCYQHYLFVCFSSWIREKQHLKVVGKFKSQNFSKVSNEIVKLEHCGVLQARGLSDNGVDHIRMAVAATHRSNPSKCIQIPPPILIKQVLLPPSQFFSLCTLSLCFFWNFSCFPLILQRLSLCFFFYFSLFFSFPGVSLLRPPKGAASSKGALCFFSKTPLYFSFSPLFPPTEALCLKCLFFFSSNT